jgi:hypothetical protein
LEAGRWCSRRFHSASDRSLGYILLGMRRSVGDHRAPFSDGLRGGLLGNPYSLDCMK